MLLYHHPYSPSFSRFCSHICAAHWALRVLSIQLFFQCSTQAGKNDAPCSQQKGSGRRIIGSGKVNVILAFVVKLEPLIAQKMSCLVLYPIGRRWGKEHAHVFDFD